MEVIAISGPSGSGKTTRLVELIRTSLAAGRSVGAIKHTHHPLNEDDRGDTAAFLAAGARPVILAGDGEAVVFDGASTKRVAYAEPQDLLVHCTSDVVVVEGFKSVDDKIWRRP
ncbi:MAG: molybdopterin-guanine dinucleotide biosynthesis protein MobB [Acidobacteriota bacterium]